MNYNIADEATQGLRGVVTHVKIHARTELQGHMNGLVGEMKFSTVYVYLFRIDDSPFTFSSGKLISLEKGDEVSIIFYQEEDIQPYEVRKITNYSTHGTIYECL